eukprot:INCI726.2.p1 GENE.INCI726.2~~INCI726.2.p1  ORF type:complete len:781 (+),score=159.10 INCI726.2:815-3157(+)
MEPGANVEEAELALVEILSSKMELSTESAIQETANFCRAAWISAEDDDEQEHQPLYLLLCAVVDYYLVHPTNAEIRTTSATVVLNFLPMLASKHWDKREPFEFLLDRATPNLERLFVGVDFQEEHILSAATEAALSCLGWQMPSKTRLANALVSAVAGLTIRGLSMTDECGMILDECLDFWKLSAEEAEPNREHWGIFADLIRKHLPLLVPLLVDLCRVELDDPILSESIESAQDPDSETTAKRHRPTYGIDQGCGAYVTLKYRALSLHMREVQYTFPSVFNVFEHDAEIAPEVALDAQAAKFEKMDIFLHFEGDGNNDSDDEMVEMRRNFLDQIATDGDEEEPAQTTIRARAANLLGLLTDVHPIAMLPALLPKLNRNLAANGEAAWRDIEAAVLCLGVAAEACSIFLTNEIPGLMDFLVRNLSGCVPILGQSSGWAISQLASWVAAPEQVASGAFATVVEQFLALTQSPLKRFQIMAFGSIAALVESAGSAFQPFVLKLVQAVSDGMRDNILQDSSLASGVEAIGSLAHPELVSFVREDSMSCAVVETLARAWTKATGSIDKKVSSAVPAVLDELLGKKALAPESLLAQTSFLLGTSVRFVVECSETGELRKEFFTSGSDGRQRTTILFVVLRFLDSFCNALGERRLPAAFSAIPDAERLIPSLLQVLQAKSESLSQAACCLIGVLADRGCYDLLLKAHADTILRVLPRHVRARVFPVASNAVWAFTELMRVAPRELVKKRVGLMLAAAARIEENGVTRRPPDYERNADTLLKLFSAL